MSLWWCDACKALTGPTNLGCGKCGGPVTYATLGPSLGIPAVKNPNFEPRTPTQETP